MGGIEFSVHEMMILRYSAQDYDLIDVK